MAGTQQYGQYSGSGWRYHWNSNRRYERGFHRNAGSATNQRRDTCRKRDRTPQATSGDDASVTAPDTTAPDAPTGVTVARKWWRRFCKRTPKRKHRHRQRQQWAQIGTGQADSGGNFTVQITPSKINNETVNVTATDSTGNESLPTSAVGPDITAPNQPIIIAVTDDVADITGSINNNGLTNDEQTEN